MVILHLQGGLGNQLFQYAAYVSLRERFDDCYLDIADYSPRSFRLNLLEYFNTIDLKYVRFAKNKRKFIKFLFYKAPVFSQSKKDKFTYINTDIGGGFLQL